MRPAGSGIPRSPVRLPRLSISAQSAVKRRFPSRHQPSPLIQLEVRCRHLLPAGFSEAALQSMAAWKTPLRSEALRACQSDRIEPPGMGAAFRLSLVEGDRRHPVADECFPRDAGGERRLPENRNAAAACCHRNTCGPVSAPQAEISKTSRPENRPKQTKTNRFSFILEAWQRCEYPIFAPHFGGMRRLNQTRSNLSGYVVASRLPAWQGPRLAPCRIAKSLPRT